MGKDFFRKKNERYKTRRSFHLERALERDLFAACPPELQTQVVGNVVNPVAADEILWAPDLSGVGPIRFCLGDKAAIEIAGGAADHVRGMYSKAGAVVAQVVEVEGAHNIAVLRLGCSI